MRKFLKKLNFVEKISKIFKTLYFNFIQLPLITRKELNNQKTILEKQKENFEGKYGNHEYILKLMYHDASQHPSSQTDGEYLTEQLIEGRKHMNNVISIHNKYGVTPAFFYEPEICDIHNENLNNPDLVDESYLKFKDTLEIKALFEKQRIKNDINYNVYKTNKTKINPFNQIKTEGSLSKEELYKIFIANQTENDTYKPVPFNDVKGLGEDMDM